MLIAFARKFIAINTLSAFIPIYGVLIPLRHARQVNI